MSPPIGVLPFTSWYSSTSPVFRPCLRVPKRMVSYVVLTLSLL